MKTFFLGLVLLTSMSAFAEDQPNKGQCEFRLSSPETEAIKFKSGETIRMSYEACIEGAKKNALINNYKVIEVKFTIKD